MILFRQKTFGKISIFRRGGKLDKVVEKAKENPLATIGMTSSIGFGSFNAAIALKRSKNEKKFQKEQIEATNNLTKAIEGNDNSRETLKKKKRILKKSQKPYTRDYYLPKTVENVKDKIIKEDHD